MPEFPSFVKSTANRIATSSQFTGDVEGYVFDGADGCQVGLWTAHADRVSARGERVFDVNTVPIFAGTQVSHALLFLYDVTDRKREAEDLRQARGPSYQ